MSLMPIGFLAASGASSSMELISTATGTGSSNLITFTNIPQTYKHLQIRGVVRTAYGSTVDTVWAYNFNNNTGSTGSANHQLYGNGSSVYSTASTGNSSAPIAYTAGSSATANTYGAVVLDIVDYASTVKNKTLRSFWGFVSSGNYQVGLTSNLPVTLPGTNAVSTLSLISNGNYTTATRFSLYGIKG